VGSVETQLLARARYFASDAAPIAAEFLFGEDTGVASELSGYGPVHVEPSIRGKIALLRERPFDLLVPIDSPDHLDAIEEAKAGVPVLLEVHTTAEIPLHRLSTRFSIAGGGYLVPSGASRRMLVEEQHLAADKVQVLPFMIEADELDRAAGEVRG